MLPMFKKSHISTRSIEDYISKGLITNYSEDSNKRNALKQASLLYKMVDGELYRHGSTREYAKYGLRVVIHDDEPQRKLDIISKGHIDESDNHYGMNNTIKNVNKLYYWHGLSSHVKMFLKKCTHCKERSKFSMEEWLEEEKKLLKKRRLSHSQAVQMSAEIKHEIKNLGRIRKSTPPETFFIVTAERKVDLDNFNEDAEMLIDSNNIEYVVETLGNCEDGKELKEVCHVMNVPDIVPLPERYRSREIENFLKYGTYPSDFTSNQKSGLRGPAVQYSINDDELYHNSNKKNNSGLRLVIHDDNPALKVKIMVECHLDEDGNHLGLNRTMNKVAEKYFWLGLSLDTRKFMMKCKICTQNRGKRLNEDTTRFSDEVKKLKAKQFYQETGTANDEEVLTAYTVNSDGTINETSNQENYDQVYRLVGNDENDVTEITVKVVNGEIVETVQQEETHQVLELDEAQLLEIANSTGGTVQVEGGGNSTVGAVQVEGSTNSTEGTVQVEGSTNSTEGRVQVEGGANSAGDMVQAGGGANTTVGTVQVEGGANSTRGAMEVEGGDGNKTKDDSGTEVQESEGSTETQVDEGSEPLTIVAGAQDTNVRVESDDNVIEMNAEDASGSTSTNKAKENENTLTEDGGEDSLTTDNEVSVETAIEMLVNNETSEPDDTSESEQTEVVEIKPGQMAIDQTKAKLEGHIQPSTTTNQPSKLIVFYEDCIYVPRNKKTRALERYLTSGNVTMGYTTSKLKELAQSFMLEDGVLYRRASRYKGRQIVIHDDQPEIKFRMINEHHRKPSGDHCTEMITYTNTQYKFYWEEMRWDVNRFFHKCTTCVRDGVEIKTKKKVLTMKEWKVRENEQRRKVAEYGISAKRNRNFREEHKIKLEKFKNWSKYGKPFYDMEENDDENIETIEINTTETGGTVEDDESDIDINLDEEEEETHVEEMVKLTVYATQAQEQQIRELFQEKGWDYGLESMSRCVDQNFDSDDLYEMVMMTTSEQDQAIQELFKSVSTVTDITDIAGEVSPTQTIEVLIEPVEPPPTTPKRPPTSTQKKKPVKNKEKDDANSSQEELTVKSKGTKRTAPPEVSTPPSESRRPRREIKKPRRFSPDRMEEEQRNMSPKKTPKTPKTNDKTKSSDTPKVQNSKQGMDKNMSKANSSPQKNKGPSKNNTDTNKKASEKSDVKKSISKITPLRSTRSTGKSILQVIDNTHKRKLEEAELKADTEIIKSSLRIKQAKVVQKNSKDIVEKDTVKDIRQGKQRKSTDVVTVQGADTKSSGKDDVREDPAVDEDTCRDELMDFDEENDDDFSDMDDDVDDDDDDDDTSDRSGPDSALEVLKTDKEFLSEVVNVDGIYLCSSCDAEFVSEDECTVHRLQNKCYVNCEVCNKVFKKNEKVELQKHMSLHDSSEKYPCTSCSKVFTDSQSLDIHSRFHSNKKEEKCRLCAEKFHTSFQVASHLYRVHGESNVFNCDVCKAKFVNINFMRCEVLFDGILSYFKCVMCHK